MKKPKKQRFYKLAYWSNCCRHDEDRPFKSLNEAFKWMYSNDYKPLSAKFIGWYYYIP